MKNQEDISGDGTALSAHEALVGRGQPASGAVRPALAEAAVFPPTGRENTLIFVLFCLLTVLLTYPLSFHLADKLSGAEQADNLERLWLVWYPAHALFDLHKWPLFDPDIYVPFGFDLIRNQDLSPATSLLPMPVTYLLGEVMTYNLIMLISFPLTGLGTYLLARELWRNRPAAFLAGVIVAFCTYRATHAVGHLNISSTQYLPFFFFYLERLIRQPRYKHAVLTGVFFALSAFATWTYAWVGIIAGGAYILARVNWGDRKGTFSFLSKGIVAAGVVALIVGPLAVPYAIAARSGAMTAREPMELQAFSASIADFFIPDVQHPFWGHWVREHWRAGNNGAWLSEWQVYIGALAGVLALAGIFFRPRRLACAWVILGVISFILALGPSLYITHPATLVGANNHVPLSAIPLPVSFLGALPPFCFLRAWARLAFVVELSVGVLAAAGFSLLCARVRGPLLAASGQWILALALSGLCAFDTTVLPYGVSSPDSRPVDKWLASQPGDFAFMEYPIPDNAYSGRAMYSTRQTGKRIIMGYASYPPNLPFWETLNLFPSPETIELLARWGTKYVLVDELRYQAGVKEWGMRHTWQTLEPALRQSNRLHEVAFTGGIHVYEIREASAESLSAELLADPGFEQAATNSAASWTRSGAPRIDATGKEAHSGICAIRVTEHDFCVSPAVPVEAGHCYRIAAFNKATERSSQFRLQVNWMKEGREMDPSTASIEIEPSFPQWTSSHAEFRAPPGSQSARIYAVAQQGSVWLDDFSLRESGIDLVPDLMVSPNPLRLAEPEGKTGITWNGGGEFAQLYVAGADGHEALAGEGVKGASIYGPIAADEHYEARLYLGKGNARHLVKTQSISAVHQTTMLTASPNPVITRGGPGSTRISWSTMDGVDAQVFVSQNGEPRRLFTQGPSGSADAPWISPGITYDFSLYSKPPNPQQLASLRVVGQEGPKP